MTRLAGLTKNTRDMRGFHHVTAMADYALRIREQLSYVNEHSFNNFRIRIGETLALNTCLDNQVTPWSECGRVRPSVIVQEDNTGTKHPAPLVLNGLSQFLQCIQKLYH
jgi:hypothetical protein